MKPWIRKASVFSFCVLLAGELSPALAKVTGQWDFTSGDLSPTVGTALQYRTDTASLTQFGTTVSFGISNIKGQVASVMRFPATSPAQGWIMTHGAAPNSGGARVNRYTV